jgi:hypothetical protein
MLRGVLGGGIADQPRLVVGQLEVALGERDPVTGPAATRLTASAPPSGS